jgi:hypothetical protein
MLNRGPADHVLVVFLDVLRHQRVDPSRRGAEAEHQQDHVDRAHDVSGIRQVEDSDIRLIACSVENDLAAVRRNVEVTDDKPVA